MAMFTTSPRKIEVVPDLEDLGFHLLKKMRLERVQSLASSRGRNFQSDGIDQGIIDLDAATANTPLVEVVATVGVELDYAATANTPHFYLFFFFFSPKILTQKVLQLSAPTVFWLKVLPIDFQISV